MPSVETPCKVPYAQDISSTLMRIMQFAVSCSQVCCHISAYCSRWQGMCGIVRVRSLRAPVSAMIHVTRAESHTHKRSWLSLAEVKTMQFTRITLDPQQMGGMPCIRGMRIPVATVVGMVADGMDVEEILHAFPDLEADDIRQALQYAAEALRERTLPAVTTP